LGSGGVKEWKGEREARASEGVKGSRSVRGMSATD
jgi:hypothetical protein